MRSRPAIIALAVLLAACYRPSSSITSNHDAGNEAQPDPAVEPSEEIPEEVLDEPVHDAQDAQEDEPVLDAVEDDAGDAPDLGELPVTFAPDFALEDLNPNSPTFGEMRRLSDERGKVIVFYIGNYG
ncbi:MAG: hypothetical protein JRG91_11860 [Deltaproteobacteria bacterium]|nr:hypothetical protein [Deltaproteobacteria bacterium]